MTDTTIIWRYLNRVIMDDHPSIYIYCTSYAIRSRETAFNNIMRLTKNVFTPLPDSLIISTIKQFLEFKRKAYLKGEVRVKPLYEHRTYRFEED